MSPSSSSSSSRQAQSLPDFSPRRRRLWQGLGAEAEAAVWSDSQSGVPDGPATAGGFVSRACHELLV